MTRADIESVIRLIPTIGVGGHRPYTANFQSRRESNEQYLARQEDKQKTLLESGPILSLICVWCSAVRRRRTVDRDNSSYDIKGSVERDLGKYLTNGEFITAAVFCGIPFEVIPDSPNAFVGISRRVPRGNYGWMMVTGPIPGEPAEWWSALEGSEGEALWRAVIATPGDGLRRGVLADWLEERNLPQWGQWLRQIPSFPAR